MTDLSRARQFTRSKTYFILASGITLIAFALSAFHNFLENSSRVRADRLVGVWIYE